MLSRVKVIPKTQGITSPLSRAQLYASSSEDVQQVRPSAHVLFTLH